MTPKVSFCTSCMNRLVHLKETYEKNIMDCYEFFPDVEFILVNYNSADNMDFWVRKNLMRFIDKGILKYYHTLDPKYWDMSHAKNVSHRLGAGQILCNLDGDNYLGGGFYQCIIDKIYDDPTKFIRERGRSRGGRLALHKQHFYYVRGYDENFCMGWGYEDSDLHKRLERIGLSWVKPVGFEVIHHSNLLRTLFSREKNMLESRDIHLEILEWNNENNIIIVNQNKPFGSAVVYKNFNLDEPIVIDEV